MSLNKLKPKKISDRKGGNKFEQGYYNLINQSKYRGNPYSVIYRSSYEKRFCGILDVSENVKEWSCEAIAIKYKSPIDGKIHTYYPDFVAKHLQKDGSIKKIIYEIKPSKFLIKPNPINFKDRGSYKRALANYIIIMEKKKATEIFCQKHNYEYKFISERSFK